MSKSLVENYAAAFSMVHKAESLPWLAAYRQDAFDQLQEISWPTRRHENWKYTDLTGFSEIGFQFGADQSTGITQEYFDALRFEQENTHQLVFINGQYSSEYSNIGTLVEHTNISNLRSALINTPSLCEKVFNQCVCSEQHIFATLNTALFSDGAFIYVPDSTIIEQPITLYFISNSMEQKLVTMPRNLIVLGKQAQASVIESFHGLEGAVSFTNTITEIETADGAVLEHYKIQQEAGEGFHIGGTHLKQHRSSRVESHSFSLGGAMVRNDISTDLVGEGAEISLNGFYKADGHQHVDNHTLVNHVKAHTQSEQDYRGILDNVARAVFNGKVIVGRDAQKVQAKQSNANILLSDRAEIDTKPELQIYADDVQCSHGTTVGQLDEDIMFYLRSRGIGKETARNLLLLAFIEDVMIRTKFIPVRERLRSNLIGELSDTHLTMADFVKEQSLSV